MSVMQDPYFDSVILLVNPIGTDGGTTFRDDSLYNRTVTRFGNTVIDDATAPTGMPTSMLLDGTGDYLQVPNNAAFSVGASGTDFTLEAYFKVNVGGRSNTIYNKRDTSGAEEISLSVGATNLLSISAWRAGSAVEISINSGVTTVNDGNWHHAAAVRYSTTWELFLDGVSCGVATQVNAIASNSQGPRIGRDGFNTGRDFNGWLGPVRFTSGVARYQGGTAGVSYFTPPDCPFPDRAFASVSTTRRRSIRKRDPYWDNVVTLLGFDSTEGVAQNPIVDSAPWVQSNGGSSIWGGPVGSPVVGREHNRSYMSLNGGNHGYNSEGSSEVWGTGAGANEVLTFEMLLWENALAAAGSEHSIISQRDETNSNIRRFFWYIDDAGILNFTAYGTAGAVVLSLVSANTVPLNAWNHVAIVRDYGDWAMFLNGVLEAAGTESANLYNATSVPVRLARDIHGTDSFYLGRMDEVRLTHGVARYTQDFSVGITGITGDFGNSAGKVRGRFPRSGP